LIQEETETVITPYEKNLEFWRQLWRVIERSDLVVQIVDCRNPLLFRSKDLEAYVKEVSALKQNLILLNKADFLTDKQRQEWGKYFKEKLGTTKFAFFSAIQEDDLDSIAEDADADVLKSSNDSDESEEDEEHVEEKTEHDKEDVISTVVEQVTEKCEYHQPQMKIFQQIQLRRQLRMV